MTILREFFFRENDLKQKVVIASKKNSISYPSSQLMFTQELTAYDTSIALQLDSIGFSFSVISRRESGNKSDLYSLEQSLTIVIC